MGGCKTKQLFEYGRMQVLTSKPSHVPGETVFGQVQVQLEQSFPGKQLLVEVIATEKTYWRTYENKSVHIHKGKHELLRMTLVA